MKTITTGWNFFRVARLLLGIAALVQAIMLREWPLALAGMFIAGMALFNTGCGIGGCAPRTNYHNVQQTEIKEIEYEELDAKK
ncbi:MAG: hypothetical protein MUE71_12645 [Chitinophagaceae bacterium]|jgi:hypothetical protein|nr:hypothetical protein [Chitinophagaceae bacterium]